MAYKCNNCGHIFEEGEVATWKESHGFTDGFYETFTGCPMCRGDYEETTPCENCGSEKTENELFCGYCRECLTEQMTKKVAIQYLVEYGDIVDFAFTVLFDAEVPKQQNKKLREFVVCYVRKNSTLEQLREYIFDDDVGVDHFASWFSFMENLERG